MTDTLEDRQAAFDQAAHNLFTDPSLTAGSRRNILTRLVRSYWGALPPFSTLKYPLIEEVQKVTVGSGVVPTFIDKDGRRKILLLQAGPHYEKADGKVLYMIPGGFPNLTHIEGSAWVAARPNKPENPRFAGAREIEEELQTNRKRLLAVHPRRLKPIDVDVLTLPSGEPRLVLSMMLELTRREVTKVKKHVQRLEIDPAYRQASSARTINKFTGKAEVVGAKIFDLQDVIDGQCALLNEDQKTLFGHLHNHFSAQPQPRRTPWQGFGRALRTRLEKRFG